MASPPEPSPSVAVGHRAGVGPFGQKQVVLAEHSGGHPSEHCTELRAGGAPGHAGQGPGHGGGTHLVEDGLKQVAERGDVVAHPPGPVDDPGTGRARDRVQPGGLDDEGFGLGGGCREVVLELGQLGTSSTLCADVGPRSGELAPTHVATRSATSHDTGLVTGPVYGDWHPGKRFRRSCGPACAA